MGPAAQQPRENILQTRETFPTYNPAYEEGRGRRSVSTKRVADALIFIYKLAFHSVSTVT